MAKSGRPSKYKIEYAEQAYKLCLLGSTDKQLANFFEVEEKTVNTWKKQQTEFLQSLKRGKNEADANVASKLYTRAIGYSYEEVTFEKIGSKEALEKTPNEQIAVEVYKKKLVIKQIPPDTTAQIFWLKNRQREHWRDKQSFEIDFDSLTDAQLDAIINRLIQASQKNQHDPE